MAIFFQFGTCENPGYFYQGQMYESLNLGCTKNIYPK